MNCGYGKYSDTIGAKSPSVCTGCALGEFANSAGSAACSACPAGTSAGEIGSASCSQCAGNTISSDLGQSSCANCASSQVSNEAKTACAACGAGKYFSSGACVDCSPGHVRPSNAADNAACTQCGENTYSNTDLTACTACTDSKTSDPGSFRVQDCRSFISPCPENTFQEGESSDVATCKCRPGFGNYSADPQCPGCALGYYRAGYSRDECSSCETFLAGSITLATQRTSSSECVCRTTFVKDVTANECQCPAGKEFVANNDGADDDVCESCADSNYKASSGNVGCTSCGAHFTTGGPGAIAQSNCECKTTFILNSAACKCAAGLKYSAASKLCVLCEPGKFSDMIALNEECTSCAAGTYPTEVSGSETCTSCGEGKYSTTVGATYSSTCLNCPLGKWSESVGAGE